MRAGGIRIVHIGIGRLNPIRESLLVLIIIFPHHCIILCKRLDLGEMLQSGIKELPIIGIQIPNDHIGFLPEVSLDIVRKLLIDHTIEKRIGCLILIKVEFLPILLDGIAIGVDQIRIAVEECHVFFPIVIRLFDEFVDIQFVEPFILTNTIIRIEKTLSQERLEEVE